MATKQTKDSVRQIEHDENLYKLRLYVVGNNKKSQLAFDNLKEICNKYLAQKCHIEVIDLTKNPDFARQDQIIAIPTLVRKNYPGKKIIGDLSNQERVLEFLNLRIDNPISIVNEKGYVDKTTTEESKARILRSKKSEYDLQPYMAVIHVAVYLKK
jgi:circadian clock protein KaiB